MQIDQLFEFVYVLIDKKQATAKEMAARFGVSVRTIYRWVDALCVSGVPIYALKGRNGGIAIEESYTLDKRILSDEEKLAIVSSVRALNSLSGSTASFVNASLKAAEKIAGDASENSDWLEVDFAPWSPEGEELRTLFEGLRDSILKRRQVNFVYYSTSGKTEKRTVHPWKLVYKGHAWYLKGWCSSRKEERFFKLSRMRDLVMTGRNAGIPKIKDEGKGKKKKAPPLDFLTVKAKVFSPRIAYFLDTFICSKVLPCKDGSVTATFSVPKEEWAYELLLSFHARMKIISPKSVRDKVLSLAKDVQRLYND